MRYTEIRFKMKTEEEVYRIYVTDALFCLTTQRGLTQAMSKRYIDVIRPERNFVEETRSPQEIIDTISGKLERLKNGCI